MEYEAKFTPTVEDAVAGYRMRNHQSDDFWKLGAFGGITAVVVFGIAAYVWHALILAVTGIFVGAGVVGVPWLMEWNFRRRVQRAEAEEQIFHFTEDGFQFSNGIMQSKDAWDKITKASLDERGVMFYIGSENYSFFIPARAFPCKDFPLQELKSLLSSKKIKMG